MGRNNDKFIYFSLEKDGNIILNEKNDNAAEFVLPRHPETNDLDVYYLQSMLKYFDPSKEILENDILDAFPVLSLTKDKESKFYKLSIYRLREFYKGQIDEDEYIQASVKHLFMYSLLAKPNNKTLKRVIAGCLDKVTPAMYRRDERDTVDWDKYQLQCLASYVPTSTFKIMKLLRGWIEGALHFYDYSIMFFDHRFVGFDDFSENIIDLKTEGLLNIRGYPRKYVMDFPFYTSDHFTLDECEMYYELELILNQIFRKWLFTPPSNDNERDGKVMMFRNNDLKTRLEDILTCFFRKDSFRLNDVFKWNRYLYGGKFDSHYDTMFVQHSSEECSLYTLLVYLEVEGDSFMYLSGEKEVQVRLESNKAYIIPHWVRHRVEGKGKREFIKTEIVFPNKHIGTTYDQTLADAFDASCYYMLQSVRHPELKDIVSQNFNTINEARFYRTVYMPKLINNVFFVKTILKIPFEYYNFVNGSLIKTTDLKFNFITDGTYYYFKTNNNTDETKSKLLVPRNYAIIMLSLMQLDIQPKKMFMRQVKECRCGKTGCIEYYDYEIPDFDINEEIFHWEAAGVARGIADTLHCVQYPSDMGEVYSVGNILVSDIRENTDTFYFAACENIYQEEYTESLVTEITSLEKDGIYRSLNVELIGEHKNIVKIRQHSFKNGIIITRRWIKTLE